MQQAAPAVQQGAQEEAHWGERICERGIQFGRAVGRRQHGIARKRTGRTGDRHKALGHTRPRLPCQGCSQMLHSMRTCSAQTAWAHGMETFFKL